MGTKGAAQRARAVGTLLIGAVAIVSIAAVLWDAPAAHAVGPNPASIVLTSSANPSVNGQTITFTASVSGGGATPTGSVNFLRNGAVVATKALAAGVAKWTDAPFLGSSSMTATYGGDSFYATATSVALTQVVNAASTSTAVTSSTEPAVVGSPVTLTATVSAVAPGTGTANQGTVRFLDGVTPIGSATPGSGKAKITVTNLAVGAHTLTAVFDGFPRLLASTSAVPILALDQAAAARTGPARRLDRQPPQSNGLVHGA